MSEETRQDIRALLKRFGIKADEVITAHLEAGGDGDLNLRLTLEDTAGVMPPLTVESTIRR